MSNLYYALGVVLFVVAILASIGLHELGHMIPARKFGGKVTQYFIGFGPTVWSKQVGETEYGVKAIPLGGYVKIVGMLPPGAADLADEVEVDAEGNQVVRVRKSWERFVLRVRLGPLPALARWLRTRNVGASVELR